MKTFRQYQKFQLSGRVWKLLDKISHADLYTQLNNRKKQIRIGFITHQHCSNIKLNIHTLQPLFIFCGCRTRFRTVTRMSSIRGPLPLCNRLDIENLIKIPLIYSVSYFHFGGLGALLGGLSSPKHLMATGLTRFISVQDHSITVILMFNN